MYRMNDSPVATICLLRLKEKFVIGSGISLKSTVVAARFTAGKFKRFEQELEIVGRVSPADVKV